MHYLPIHTRSKDTIEYTFSSQSLQLGIGYKVNIHALVTTASNNLIESKELHQKIEAKSEKELTIYVPNDNMSIFSGNTGWKIRLKDGLICQDYQSRSVHNKTLKSHISKWHFFVCNPIMEDYLFKHIFLLLFLAINFHIEKCNCCRCFHNYLLMYKAN